MIQECNFDIRKIIHRIQYGDSYIIPKYQVPTTGLPIENAFILRQKMFDLPDVLHEYRVGILDNVPTSKTSSRCTRDDIRDHIAESDTHRTKLVLGKSRNSKKKVQRMSEGTT
jgi:hypothetical protein